MNNPISYYNLEEFLLSDVRNRFLDNNSIGAFDFFSIIVWKSNRSKSIVAKRLIVKSKNSDLEQISLSITSSISRAHSDEEKMKVLIESWGFKLAIASAILTILYPDRFTVYDYRAAKQLNFGANLKNKSSFADIWAGYVEFKDKVAALPFGSNLRDKDRYLFGRSTMDDLLTDLKCGFQKRM